jgi:hypothetical protein
MKRTKHRALAAAIWCVALFGYDRAAAQIIDPVQAKSWDLLQKIAIEFTELQDCWIIAMAKADHLDTRDWSNPEAKQYSTAASEKGALFVREADAYVQRYASRDDAGVQRYASRDKDETLEAFRFRVWQIPIQLAIRNARPIEKLNLSLCRTLAP